jgi:hypothetical protein
MSRQGLRSRARTYTFAAVAVVGASFCAALMVTPSGSTVQKIGPGYARMQPIDEGKAEKVAYSVPYSIPARPHASKAKAVRIVRDPVLAEFFGASAPLVVAAAQPPYSRDHRVY